MTSKHWRLLLVNGTVYSTDATAHRQDEATSSTKGEDDEDMSGRENEDDGKARSRVRGGSRSARVRSRSGACVVAGARLDRTTLLGVSVLHAAGGRRAVAAAGGCSAAGAPGVRTAG